MDEPTRTTTTVSAADLKAVRVGLHGQGHQEGASQMQAGRLGTVNVEGDKVMLGDILVFTKENIDQFDF